MQREFVVRLAIIASISIACLFAWGVWQWARLFECVDEVVSVFPSPGGATKAVYFTRDCGATASVAHNIAVDPAKKRFQYRKKRIVFTCMEAGCVTVLWEGEQSLKILYECNNVFKKVERIDGVAIGYERLSREKIEKH